MLCTPLWKAIPEVSSRLAPCWPATEVSLSVCMGVAQANLETVLAFELAQEDYDAITNIDFQLRLVDGIRFLRPEGPFRFFSPFEPPS